MVKAVYVLLAVGVKFFFEFIGKLVLIWEYELCVVCVLKYVDKVFFILVIKNLVGVLVIIFVLIIMMFGFCLK